MDGEQKTPKCRDWSAVHDRMPPGPWTLRVHGTCEFPTAGYLVELRPSESQESSVRELFLDLLIQEPSGPVPQVITEVEAHYELETDAEFEAVTIRGYVSIPVEIVW